MPTNSPNELVYTQIDLLTQSVQQVIRGKSFEIQLILTALFANGHILLEDNPGTGKTVLAKTLAQSFSDQGHSVFKRIQFTPDLLPMDLIGTHIFDENQKEFVFKKGPLFCNILLADEINRASPKVQSALLECMAEHQITIGERTYPLERLFFSIATQNPIEMEGTYPLPAAQLDRFFIKINFGYVNAETELGIYKDYLNIAQQTQQVHPVLSIDDVVAIQQAATEVYIHDEIVNTINNIVQATRNHPDIQLGASTRGGISFLKCLKAFALVNGRNYVTENDVHLLCLPVLHHRLVFRTKEAKNEALPKIRTEELKLLSKKNIKQS